MTLTWFGINMRIGAALIASTQLLASAATAQTPSEKIISILNEVCVAPASSEEKMAAGEKYAGKENWKLIRAEAAPMPFIHNENGVKNSFWSAWEFHLPGDSRAQLHVSILRPEPSDFKYTVCIIQPDIDLDGDDISRSIEREFGSSVTRDTSGRFRDHTNWFFVGEMSKGNCGKEIGIFLHRSSERGKPKTIMFTDFVYPGASPLAGSTRCPK